MIFFREYREYRPDMKLHIVESTFKTFPAHWHPEIEVIMVKSGHITAGFNFDTYTLSPGDLFLVPAGNIHYYDMRGDGKAYILMFEAMLVDKELQGCSVPLIIRNENNTLFFKEIYDHIISELNNGEAEYKTFVKLYLSLLSTWFLRKRTEDNIMKSESINKSSLLETQKLFEFIEKNYQTKLTVKMGAEIMHYSTSHFCNYFKLLTGTTFSKYINIIRCESVKNMLRTTDLKITEIAHQCGFEDIRTFTRVFKMVTGTTAYEYKRKMNE